MRKVTFRDEPKPTGRNHEQTDYDPAFVAELNRQPARGHCHEEVAQVMRELHPGGLRKAEMELLLKVLVHHVDHPVAKAPKSEEEDEEEEGEGDIAAAFEHKHSAPRGLWIHPRRSSGARFGRCGCCSHKLTSGWFRR